MKKLRAAIYSRVSTDKQEDEGTSLETQEAGCIRHCQAKGYSIVTSLVIKEVFTGTVYRERPLLTKLREAVRNHEIDVLVIYAYDRLSRDPVHLGVLMDEFDHENIVLESVTEPTEQGPIGQFVLFARGMAAKIEVEKFKERSARAKRFRAEGKKHMLGQGKPAYGYKWSEGHTAYLYNDDPIMIEGQVLCDESGTAWTERKVIECIFAMAKQGVSIRQIAFFLTDIGIRTRKGRSIWPFSTIRAILCNEEYTGKAVANRYKHLTEKGKTKRVILRPVEEHIPLPDGTIPPIIDGETFTLVQRRLERNKEEAARNNKHPKDALLRCGIALCAYCGCYLNVQRHTGHGRNRKEYFCKKRSSRHGERHNVAISVAILDAIVWQEAVAHIKDPEKIKQKVAEARAQRHSLEERSKLTVRLERVKKKLQNIATLAEDAEDEDVLENYRRRQRELEQEKAGIESLLADVEISEEQERRIQEAITRFEHWCERIHPSVDNPQCEISYDEKRDAICMLGIKVLVRRAEEEERIAFRYAPPDIMAVLYPDYDRTIDIVCVPAGATVGSVADCMYASIYGFFESSPCAASS